MSTSGIRGLRLGKCWQHHKTIVWQVGVVREGPSSTKKMYLCVRLGMDAPLELVATKPQGLSSAMAVPSLCRKFLSNGVVERIIENKVGLWIQIHRGGQRWWVLVGSEFILIDPEQVMRVRFGPSGTFTHKRRRTDVPEPDGGIDVLPDLAAQALAKTKDTDSDVDVDMETTSDHDHEPADVSSYQREVSKRLSRRLKTLRKSLSQLQSKQPSQQDIRRLTKAAEYLKTFSYLVEDGVSRLRVPLELVGEDQEAVSLFEVVAGVLEIPLDPDLSIGSNIAEHFKEVKKAERALTSGRQQITRVQRNVDLLVSHIETLKTKELDDGELQAILSQHKLSAEKQVQTKRRKASDASLPYRVYTSSDKTPIFVGKGSTENDELTKKAKANDLWLHVVNEVGSHIVIPFRTLPDKTLSDATKRQAAILAIHNSKLRKQQQGEVYFTTRQMLKKRKGMPPGLWEVTKSETFYCKYDEGDLKAILDNQ